MGGRKTAVQRISTTPLSNELLATLPRRDFERLAPRLKTVSFEQGHLLSEPGDDIDHVYFPHTGMVSLLVVMRDGKAIECATVGREGAVGATTGLRSQKAGARAVVQLPMIASEITAAALRKVVKESPALLDMIVRQAEVQLIQTQVTAGCNALHHVDARLARWILQCRDRTENDTIGLTQEFLSEMLGVRRTSVSEVAQKLLDAKLIRYSRGTIEIIDRAGLERTACECYRAIADRFPTRK